MRAGRLLLTLSCRLLVLHFSVFAAGIQADESARGWLERMTLALQQQNYRGVLVYGEGQQWQTLDITHGVIDGVEQEKLLHLNGQPRETVRHGQDILCIHSGEHSPGLNSELSNPLHGFARVLQTADQYHFTLGRAERIAGRFAQQVHITPVDNNRYGYQLWLDQATGLLLRSDLLGNHQQVLERFQFARIDVGLDLSAEAFQPDGLGHKFTQTPLFSQQPPLSTEGIGWQPGWVPAGFRITAVIQAGLPPSADLAAQNATGAGSRSVTLPVRLMYSDGLAAFTLFIDPVNLQQMPEITRRWGATAAVVRYREVSGADDSSYHGRLRVTVVGELPTDTMIRIATSIVADELAEHHADVVNKALAVAEE